MLDDLIYNRNLILDRILDSYSEDIPDRYHNGYEMMTDFNAREILDLDGEKWKSLMDKLIIDGYFINKDFPSGQKAMVITEKGKLFWNNGKGGYVNQYNNELRDQKRRIDLENSVIKTNELLIENQKGQKRITIITILVAIVGAVGTLGQWLLPLSKSHEEKDKQEQHHKYHRHFKNHHHNKSEKVKKFQTG